MFEKIREAIKAETKRDFERALGWVRSSIKDVVQEYDKLEDKGVSFVDAETVKLLQDLESIHERIEKRMKGTVGETSDTVDLSKPEVTV